MAYKKVSKTIARKMFNRGITIYLLPNKVSEVALYGVSPWIKAAQIDCKNFDSFDSTVNEYSYYNCNSELGKNPSYYVEVLQDNFKATSM